ncbi:MAG: hypothetical protein LBG84_05325 [Treponema sp.]|nr:hypothetical protein [Treponema sp.]
MKPIEEFPFTGNHAGESAGDAVRQNGVLVSEETPSFEVLLDQMCERLQKTQTQGSLRRIQKMEAALDALERELDEMLGKQTG